MTAALQGQRIAAAHRMAVERLLSEMRPEGYWGGRLSSSALSTATAVSALALAGRESDAPLVAGGIAWLAHTQNGDGGWGDTPDSPSNLATTLLALSALRLAEGSMVGAGLRAAPSGCSLQAAASGTCRSAEAYVACKAGNGPEARVAAIRRVYGADRTFAVPILMNCALAGLVPWQAIPGLPFELAVLPRGFYRAVRLHVVSYALPALIAIGALLARRSPARNPAARTARRLLEPPALAKLATLQPAHGGFLEATPLTAFVGMSLVALFGDEHPVARRCLGFLRASVRADGSWPIDTNLSVWLTTGAVSALCAGGEGGPPCQGVGEWGNGGMGDEEIRRRPFTHSPTHPLSHSPEGGGRLGHTRQWILERQLRTVHPYTGAAPGGWSWTHLPGGVPDADDTSGAMVALARLSTLEGKRGPDVESALQAGAEWLLGLQNHDGGWPTFCRGWGQLPFDRSSPDITAHALRALLALRHGPARAMARGLRFLERAQRPDGAWVPLWFGNQEAPGQANPVYCTARVLAALAEVPGCDLPARKGIEYLVGAQGPDGEWGGDRGVRASVEETALATSALAAWAHVPEAREAMRQGAEALARRVERDDWTRPAPIGLYFASLWYSEALYPVIWTVDALGAARRVSGGRQSEW